MKNSVSALAAMASLLALGSGPGTTWRTDEAAQGMAFAPRNSRQRWKRQVRRGRVVRHRR